MRGLHPAPGYILVQDLIFSLICGKIKTNMSPKFPPRPLNIEGETKKAQEIGKVGVGEEIRPPEVPTGPEVPIQKIPPTEEEFKKRWEEVLGKPPEKTTEPVSPPEIRTPTPSQLKEEDLNELLETAQEGPPSEFEIELSKFKE